MRLYLRALWRGRIRLPKFERPLWAMDDEEDPDIPVWTRLRVMDGNGLALISEQEGFQHFLESKEGEKIPLNVSTLARRELNRRGFRNTIILTLAGFVVGGILTAWAQTWFACG